jgi:hypothetical protein
LINDLCRSFWVFNEIILADLKRDKVVFMIDFRILDILVVYRLRSAGLMCMGYLRPQPL